MSEAEVKAAFAGIDPQHPFYLAMLQICDDAIVIEQDGVTLPELTDAARHFNAGRLAHAKDFKDYIRNTITLARIDRERERQKFEAAEQRRQAG